MDRSATRICVDTKVDAGFTDRFLSNANRTDFVLEEKTSDIVPGFKESKQVGTAYLKWFYESHIWRRMHYQGVPVLKFPQDMWSYQEILTENQCSWVVEAGTRFGGSALLFADCMSLRRGRVITIDIDHDSIPKYLFDHPRIEFVKGSSADEAIVDSVWKKVRNAKNPVFIILDSDHTMDHVYRELELFVPKMRSGDYLVVEDTLANGHPVRSDFGPGPMEALAKFIETYPDMLKPDADREAKFGCSFAPKGFFTKI